MKEIDRQRIDKIMDNFNFHKVARVMEFLHWGWGDTGVPSESEIRKFARRQMEEACKQNYRESSTGGFSVRRISGEIYLTFELASWDSDYRE